MQDDDDSANNLDLATTCLYVDDVAEMVDFYREAIGLEPRFFDANLGFAELGADGRIAIASHEAGEFMMPDAYRARDGNSVSGTELAFYAGNVQAAYDRAVVAGARALTPPRKMDWGQTVAYVEDPAGTIIGFISPPTESSSGPDG